MQIIVIIAESTTGNTPCNSTQSQDKADHGDGFQTPTRDSGIMVEEKVNLQKVKDAQYFFFWSCYQIFSASIRETNESDQWQMTN